MHMIMSSKYSKSAQTRFMDPYDEQPSLEQSLEESLEQKISRVAREYGMLENDAQSIGYGGLSEGLQIEFNRNYDVIFNLYCGGFSRAMRIIDHSL
jgi:hypothetical protein